MSRGWPAQQWSDWQKQSRSLQALAAYSWTLNFLLRDDGSESMEGMAVTGDYFHVAALTPLMGRTLLTSETSFPTVRVIMLGYNLWQRAFHGNPNIVGKTERMIRRQTPPTVVGLMPPGVRFSPSPGWRRNRITK